MCERRLLRELNPRRQMTQRIRPRLEDDEEEEEEPSQVWNSSGGGGDMCQHTSRLAVGESPDSLVVLTTAVIKAENQPGQPVHLQTGFKLVLDSCSRQEMFSEQ